MFETVKSWFKNSESILLARTEVVAGFLVAALSAVDWSPLLSAGADPNFTLGLGAVMVVKGLVSEWARRRNTIEVDQRLIPTALVKEVKTEVILEPVLAVVDEMPALKLAGLSSTTSGRILTK